MSDLSLSLRWNAAINQVDIDEPVLGGDGGNANLATRQLTIEETASHEHNLGGLRERSVKTATSNLGTDNYTNTNLIVRSTTNNELFEPAGGDQPHNNIQPSIVAGCWVRTA